MGYLTVLSVFTVLRLLPMGDRDKDVEILALRHQIAVLERQLGQQRVHFTAPDRALLAALLHRLPRQALRRLRLLVRPDTVLRWHRGADREPTCHPVAAQTPGPAPHRAFDPPVGTAPGQGEPRLGVSTAARRTARARGEGRPFYRVGAPAGSRDRPRTRTLVHDLG